MTEVIYTEAARADLLDIWLYISDESLAAADHVLDALEKDVMLLASQPLAGRERPELGDRVRSWPSSTPYVLFYTVTAEHLIMVRILHHARDTRLVEMAH